MPTVSIIIPTYNRLPLLKEAIDSVLKQGFADFELIVVDDGSTDGTAEYVVNKVDDSRVVYLYENHGGVAKARNCGIHKAQAPWIAFLDSDDLWQPEKLERQLQYLNQNPDQQVCQTEEVWIRRGVRVNSRKKHQKYSGWIFEKCIPLCIVSPSAVIIHREVFSRCGLFDESFPACEDYDLWLRVALDYPITTLPDSLVIKRGGRQDQLSKRYWGMDRFRIRALEKILTHPKLSGSQRKLVEENLAFRYKVLKKGAVKRGKFLEEVMTESIIPTV